jgi:predicted Rossmann-fold nucleotide-binding protein
MPRIFIEGDHRATPGSNEYDAAEKMGYELAKEGFVIVSSAGMGISEAVFSGAIRWDDSSRRVAIDCDEINLPRNSKFNEIVATPNYFDMKMKNCINSDGFIFFPGSFEVLSNLSIIFQLKELELMGRKPVICIGEQLEEVLSTCGFYNENIVDSLEEVILADNVEEAIDKTLDAFKKIETTHRLIASSLN